MDDEGNPNFGNHLRLFSQTGYNLTIREDGAVYGSDDDSDKGSLLEIATTGEVGMVRISFLHYRLHLCFNPDGDLYGESDCHNPGTIFREELAGSYNYYRSLHYPHWFVGIKKTGAIKNGPKTGLGQKACKFLPRRVSF